MDPHAPLPVACVVLRYPALSVGLVLWIVISLSLCIAARSACWAKAAAAVARLGDRHTAAVQSPEATRSAGQYETSPHPSGSVPVWVDRRYE